MRIHTSESNLDVEVVVRANDIQIDEYMLASRPTNNNENSTTKECFVPLAANQRVSVYTWFSGTVCNVKYDLYIDGAFYGSRDIVPDKNGTAKKHLRRRTEFRGVQATILFGNKPEPKGTVVDAELLALPITFPVHKERLRSNGKAFGVGSIVVVLSCSMDPWDREYYQPDSEMFPDYMHRGWENRDDHVEDPTIPADLFIDTCSECTNITPQKANRFRHEYDGQRNGTAPVASFVFYYRRKSTLLNAGCIPAPSRPWPIAEANGEVSSAVGTEADDSDEDPYDDINKIVAQARANLERPRSPGGPLTLAQIGQSNSFLGFVMETETEREEHWRKRGFTPSVSISHCGQQKTFSKLNDDGAREVVLGDQHWYLPQSEIFKEILQPEGTPLNELASTFFPGCKGSMTHKAMYAIAEHIFDHVYILEDEHGRLSAVDKNHMKEDDPRWKRDKRAAPEDSDREEPTAKRTKLSRQQLLERQRQLADEARRIEDELAAYEDDADEDTAMQDE